MPEVTELNETEELTAPTEQVEIEDQPTAEAVEGIAAEEVAEETADAAVEPVEETETPVEADETEVAGPEADSPAADAETAEDAEETSEEGDGTEAEVAAPAPESPYDLTGDWYVIHSYSGYENKVKANLETRIQSMHMEDRIFEVHIPMEDVVEFKAGKKVTVPKKVFPGYILVRMTLDDDSWYTVRNTPGVTGFVAGNAQKPTPVSRREVERFLGVKEEDEQVKPRFKPEWEVGEQVRVVTGPFADFNGIIEEIKVDQQKVTVLVNIFGRDTPVDLGFQDIQKN